MEMMAQAAELGLMQEGDAPDLDSDPDFGMLEDDISFNVDVSDVAAEKKTAIAAHRSQVGPDSFFLKMPDEVFGHVFGTESFALPGVRGTGGPVAVDVLPGL